MEGFIDTTQERLSEVDRDTDEVSKLLSDLPSRFESAFAAGIKDGEFSSGMHYPFLQYVKARLAIKGIEASGDAVEKLEAIRQNSLRPLLDRGSKYVESHRIYKNIQLKAYQILRGSDQFTDQYQLD